jgi:hypothetical protein
VTAGGVVSDKEVPVAGGAEFTLLGSSFVDPDGTIAGWAWRQIGGPSALDPASGEAWPRAASGGQAASAVVTLKAPDPQGSTQDLYFELTVCDGDGKCIVKPWLRVIVGNQPPQVVKIAAPEAPVRVGTSLVASAQISDANAQDQHWVTWNWGDGTLPQTTALAAGVTSTPQVRKTYAEAGVYTVTVTVDDLHGGRNEKTHEYVVVYDPNGGFVSGGGTIESLPGAVAGSSSAAGKATFGFTGKYRQGAPAPEGRLNFQVKDAGIDFRAETYDSLVVTNARARLRGQGTLNGNEGYSFLLSVVDGKGKGGGGDHKYRLKICAGPRVYEGCAVVYDNQATAKEEYSPDKLISGGAVVVKGN